MTEAQWLVSASAEPMLVDHASEIGPMRLRLFAVGCARQLVTEHRQQGLALETLEFAETVAQGTRSATELRQRLAEYNNLVGEMTGAEAIVNQALAPTPIIAALATCRTLVLGLGGQIREGSINLGRIVPGEVLPLVTGQATALTANILRCVVSYPCRPITAAPSWLTSTVTALARGIYDERAFDRLPILADALQDAGCDHADILTHCRSDGPHVRGCWVVDLVLGLS